LLSIGYKSRMIRLSDLQWERIRRHFPEENIPGGRPGRKPVSTRQVLEAVLWILNTGAQWHMLPQCYPNYKTVHRRFQAWCRSEVLRGVLMDIANELRERGVLDEEECFIDATFVMAKGGGDQSFFESARRQPSRGCIGAVFGPRIKCDGGGRGSSMNRVNHRLEHCKALRGVGGHPRRLQHRHSLQKPSDAPPSAQPFHPDECSRHRPPILVPSFA
jgi:putative transposase of IS4/5 family DUF4096